MENPNKSSHILKLPKHKKIMIKLIQSQHVQSISWAFKKGATVVEDPCY